MKIKMPYQVSVKEKLPNVPDDTVVYVQPKYDGTQGIFTQVDGIPVVLTRSGAHLTSTNIVTLSRNVLQVGRRIFKEDITIFAEVEPYPWSERGKWELPGKLIQGNDSIPWVATAFDFCPTEGFFSGKYLKTHSYLERYGKLKEISEELNNIGMRVAPISMEYFSSAVRKARESFLKDETGVVRAMWSGIKCEGIVIRLNNAAYKVKPEIERDVYVLKAIRSNKGSYGWETIDTKTSERIEVWGGVTAENWQALVGKVVEVKELIVSSATGAGNATFLRSREFDKDYNVK